MKTMIRLSKEKVELSIISDQFGTPTYGGDLAQVIFHIINSKSENYGLFHYSNEGSISWFDFAKAIFEFSDIEIKLNPIPTASYPTPAKRPMYSVMNKLKIKNELNIEVFGWEESLEKTLLKLNKDEF
jgi:dTDP-4-dehydrorhamnose reductase